MFFNDEHVFSSESTIWEYFSVGKLNTGSLGQRELGGWGWVVGQYA